ncbi:ornithine aminotransferase [Ascobolus immersus RN42]|uniref:Ornithine aminotransferase n=1 Tax=Ascobolus immersus RN42 TaxID=1160509 RepID=A0A3N4IHE0_ASCIM|nr:ornithine aminotransferase [Ascobolus immersus RN42]
MTSPFQTHAASTSSAIKAEHEYAAHNYHPLPVVISSGQGCRVTDPEGRKYLDFLSAYSAVNQGHSHPVIINALITQAQRLCLSSRAFHNDVLPQYAKFVTEFFGYDMVLPMNTGAEAVETAIKIARKWGYKSKKIPQNKAIIFGVEGNFHGRTLGAISLSGDPEARDNYGPFVPNILSNIPGTDKPIRYSSLEDMEAAVNAAGPENVAAILLEPIQGEAGIVVPSDDYLPGIAALCKKHNILFICDEIQTGIARTGKLLAIDHYPGVKPDLVLLGKALSGGVYPVSAVLGSKEVMLVVEPGTHGSTYGGNPLACAVSIAALTVVKDENLIERADKSGDLFRSRLRELADKSNGIITEVRGRGLLNAIVIDDTKLGTMKNGDQKKAWHFCLLLKEKGVLAKPTHENIVRLAPPLVISEQEMEEALSAFKETIDEISTWDA